MPQSDIYKNANTFVVGVIVALVAILFVAGVIVAYQAGQGGKATEATQYGPETGPPPDAPTLDYEAMVGLDPQTQQTNTERERNNDLEFRVNKLESEMAAVVNRLWGIGEAGPTEAPPESEE